jgi:gliding motility associated protien GldN
MKKLIWLLAAMLSLPVFAQEDEEMAQEGESSDVVDGIVAKQHIKNKKHMEAAYVREANVLWSKTIWRMVDLREKQNLYLFYPTNTVDGRRSLIRVLIDNINSGDLKAYSSATDNEFEQEITAKEVFEKLGVSNPDSIQSTNPETGETEWKYVFDMSSVHVDEVMKFLVKEVWFFDKKYSRMECRIIGLCPIIEQMNEEGTRRDQKMTFWVYYPHAAQMLSEQEAFTFKNDAQRESLYDKLQKREFGSYIFKESNVYNNRGINEYSQGMSQNIEWENIQNAIFEKEHDMWEF